MYVIRTHTWYRSCIKKKIFDLFIFQDDKLCLFHVQNEFATCKLNWNKYSRLNSIVRKSLLKIILRGVVVVAFSMRSVDRSHLNHWIFQVICPTAKQMEAFSFVTPKLLLSKTASQHRNINFREKLFLLWCDLTGPDSDVYLPNS